MMLAKLSPWSIVYPLLVDINAYEGDPSEELQRIFDCLVMNLSIGICISLLVLNSAFVFFTWMQSALLFIYDYSLHVT